MLTITQVHYKFPMDNRFLLELSRENSKFREIVFENDAVREMHEIELFNLLN